MKEITKDQLLTKFKDFSSVVTYKDGRKIRYETPDHINWKNVNKITVDIPKRTYVDPKQNGGDLITRSAVAYKLI